MSEQANQANKFVHKLLGAKAESLMPGGHLRPLPDGGDGGGENDAPPAAPWIKLPGDDKQLSQFARELGQVLSDKPIFMRENVPVTVNDRTGSLEPISSDRFRTLVERYAVMYKSHWVSVSSKTQEKVEHKSPTTMTQECAKGALSCDEMISQLRAIARVNQVPMPVERADGRIELLKEGYDEETQTYTLASGVKIDEAMTMEQGAVVLRDYIKEFPFVDERSRAVAVAEMVALYVFGLQELTANRMGFIFKSNKERSGKSLAAQMGIAPCFGLAKGQTISNQEEMKKLLDASALQGEPYLFFDNLTGNIKSNLLESYMTTPVWTGRVMGSQKTFTAPKGTIVIVTGNNITTSADIAGRTLLCYLFTEEADPQARKLQRIFTAQSLAKPKVRSDFLSALWALVRGWDKAGRPAGGRRIAGFEEWASIVGGIVLAAGFEDPLQKPKDDESTNTEGVDAKVLVGQLAQKIPEDKHTWEFEFQELVDVCHEMKCFEWKLDGKMRTADGGREYFECNKASASALGRTFGTDLAGQIYTIDLEGGKTARVRFGKRGANRHRRYRVEILEDPEHPRKG